MPANTPIPIQKQEKKLAKQIDLTYRQAAREIRKKLKDFTEAYKAKNAKLKQMVQDGTLSKEDYKSWLKGQVFQSNQWKRKLDDVVKVYRDADIKAREIIGGTLKNVFMEAANYTAFDIEKDMQGTIAFNLYDKKSVERLLKDNPKMLPEWKIDEPKDYVWNEKRVQNAVAQGIIQGESIDEIGKRLTGELATSNGKKMVLFARTAMTGAQNAGRIERMHEAQDMGIEIKKQWLATLDSRTRDAHAYLDGEEADIDKPFHSILGDIMYPGDPTADPANVYNCRCTLTYVYPKYSMLKSERRDQSADSNIADMTYQEWKQSKEIEKQNEYSSAKSKLFNAEKQIFLQDGNHVFKNIWKDDVTYADYEAKKGSIQAKRDYFTNQLDKAVAIGDTANQEKFQKLLDELDLFEKNGEAMSKLLKERDAAQDEVKQIAEQFKDDPKKPQKVPAGPFTPDAYMQARKDAAMWAQSPREADKVLRGKCGEVWRNASEAERDAIYEYTQSYHKFNEPLRGIEYGTSIYKGVGNTDLNASYANSGQMLNDMTDIISRSQYDKDIWLQRGCRFSGMDKFFQCDMSLLQDGTQEELARALLGKEVTEYGFMSCGSSKGQGFSGDILLNVYAPAGTKMMYVEPFSRYGEGDKRSWDGISAQSSFGYELETLIQQGTKFRVVKVERESTYSTIYFDIEVIDQSTQQRYEK